LIYLKLNNHSIGGAQPLLTQGLLKKLEITIPKSISEQKAIAQILTAFDDKIELLQAQNKT
jgi:type I restriction enzyme S subunit